MFYNVTCIYIFNFDSLTDMDSSFVDKYSKDLDQALKLQTSAKNIVLSRPELLGQACQKVSSFKQKCWGQIFSQKQTHNIVIPNLEGPFSPKFLVWP